MLTSFRNFQVTSALHRTYGNAKRSGNVEGLLFTGLTPAGIDLLQSYVDRTADVQTAAIMASYVSPARFKDVRVERWVEAYRDFMDSLSASVELSAHSGISFPLTSVEKKKQVPLPLSI